MLPRPAGNPRREELLLPFAARPRVLVRARAVHHARARHRRRDDQPVLHDLVVAGTAAHDLDHGEARAGRQGIELAARQPAAGRVGSRARPGRRIHVRSASGAQVPVPVGRLGCHAADVDEPCAPRSRRRPRHPVRAQRPHAGRHHLRARARPDRVESRELPHVVRRRARRRAHELAGRHGLPDAAAAEADRTGFHGARDLHVRPGAIHEGGARPARRSRVRPQALSRGKLLVRNARADGERRGARRTRAGCRRRRRRDEAVHGQLREEQPRNFLRLRAARARRGAPVWRAAAGIVHAGHVRHLQGEARVGAGRDEAQRRYPPARDRSGDGAAVLQQAAVGSGDRQVVQQATGCPDASRSDKHPSEKNDTADLWLKNLERHRAVCAYQGDRP
ncbi:hypothetical protein BLAT2472_80150 [Burkholderia latens]